MLIILFIMVITEMVTDVAMKHGPFKVFVDAPDSDWGESDSSPDLAIVELAAAARELANS